MHLRRLNYTLHSWLGLGCAVFIVCFGLTGAVLVFRDEIDRAVHPRVPPAAEATAAVSADALIASIRAALPEHQLRGLILPDAETGRPAIGRLVRDGRFGEAYVDPRTGRLLGYTDNTWRNWVIQLHYSLFLGDWGAALLFPAACGLAVLGVSGLWVHRTAWKSLGRLPRFRLGQRIGYSDTHKAVGVACFLFCVILGLTGAYFNWGAVSRLSQGKPFLPWKSADWTYRLPAVPLERALLLARSAIPGFEPAGVGFPFRQGTSLTVYGSVPGQGFFGKGACSVVIDATTGRIVRAEDIRTLPWSQKWRDAAVSLHFGNFGGLPLKIVYCAASLGITLLTLTGVAIWWKRRRSQHIPRTATSADAA
jgi:uncharacterized iron-regulated membrane protein